MENTNFAMFDEGNGNGAGGVDAIDPKAFCAEMQLRCWAGNEGACRYVKLNCW